MFLPHWDFLPSPLGKDCSSLYILGKEFSSLSHSGRSLLYFPAVAGEGISFPSYWGRNFLPFLLGMEFSSLHYWGRNFLPFITGKGIFFPSYWGRNFLPFVTGEGIFFPLLLVKKFSSLHH